MLLLLLGGMVVEAAFSKPFFAVDNKGNIARCHHTPKYAAMDDSDIKWNMDRRDVLRKTASFLFLLPASTIVKIPNQNAAAAAAASEITTTSTQSNSDDMTSQLFNPDGSLKVNNTMGISAPNSVQSRTVQIVFPASSADHQIVTTTYQLPAKWSESYFDYLARIQACDRISVSQIFLGDQSDSSLLLEKASATGIAKTLQLDTIRNPELLGADLVNARKRLFGDLTYYDFDLAIAPKVCTTNNAENLGLGFCPYDRIVLLSSLLAGDGSLYVFQLECDKEEWKLYSSDLKRVRNSFTVEARNNMGP